MTSVLVVNNYPARDRVIRLERCVEGNGTEVTSLDWSRATAGRFDSYDGVVLSGSPDMMTEAKTRKKFEKEAEAIRGSKVPLLGVCFGHQLIAEAFGSKVVRDGRRVLEMVKTSVIADDPLFDGLPKTLTLLESRHEVVSALPPGFSLLAKSERSAIATMKHFDRALYGVQFHPERYTAENPDGNRVVSNFVSLLKR